MARYGGSFFIIKYLFLQYLLLSDKIVMAALVCGVIVTAAGLVMLLLRPPKKYADMLMVVSLLPICLGAIGTFSASAATWEAVRIEEGRYMVPTAYRYYDWQYLFTECMLYSFPVIIGAVGTLPGLFISMFLRRKSR